MKKKVRKVAIRRFSRNLYTEIKDLPVAVYNKRTGECVIVIISPEKAGEKFDLRA